MNVRSHGWTLHVLGRLLLLLRGGLLRAAAREQKSADAEGSKQANPTSNADPDADFGAGGEAAERTNGR